MKQGTNKDKRHVGNSPIRTPLNKLFWERQLMGAMMVTLLLAALGYPLGANAKIDPAREQQIDDFYHIDNVVTINITMDEDDWNDLWAEWPMGSEGEGTGKCEHTFVGDRFKDYPVESIEISQLAGADFTLTSADYGSTDGEGNSISNDILVTKKSYCGSFGASDYDKNQFPSIKLKFNDGPESDIENEIGTSHITLNNSKQDKSFVRQCLGYALVREDVDFFDSDSYARPRGLGVSRCNFAKVYVNGTLYKKRM